MTYQKSAVSFLALGLLAFVVLAVIGLSHMGGMKLNDNGEMTGCIFTGKAMLCRMNVIDHISRWQSMFTAIPQEGLLLIALLVLLVAAIFMTKNVLDPPRLSENEAFIQKLYLTQHPNLSLFNPLKEAFSQGILNPKICEFAIL